MENPINQLAECLEVETLAHESSITLDDFILFDSTTNETIEYSVYEEVSYAFKEQLPFLKDSLGENASVTDAVEKFVEMNSYDGAKETTALFAVKHFMSDLSYAAPSDDLSLDYFYEECDFFGFDDQNYVFPGGYSQLPKGLANGYGDDSNTELNVRLSETVESIEYDGDSVTVTTNSSVYIGSKAIVSVPLGN